MDAEQHQQAEKWFKENWRHGPCPVCQSENWSFYPRLGEISNLQFPLRGIPLLLLGCDTCGYVVAVNAIKAGISPKPETPEVAIEVEVAELSGGGESPDLPASAPEEKE